MSDHLQLPGNGWTNGAIEPSIMQSGGTATTTLQKYHTRRWIGVSQGWTRIGHGYHEHDAKTVDSKNIGEISADNVKSLIAQLCEFLYHQGWATGTGGGCSIRILEHGTWRVFVAP